MGIPTVELLEICVPSAWFLHNNIKKVQNGETARGSVVFAQGAKIAQAVAKYHDSTAKNASETFNIFGKYAQSNKALDYVGKGVNWATRNVNPLICASGVYKTVTADDKVKTGITQAGAISGMFIGEGLMKANMGRLINEENIAALAEKCKNIDGLKSVAEFLSKPGVGGKVASIIKGIAFVCVSMASYDVGERLAEHTVENLYADIGIDDENNQHTKNSPTSRVYDNRKIDRKV